MRPTAPDNAEDAQAAPKGALGLTMVRLFALLASPEMAKWRVRMGLALVLTIIAKLFSVGAPILFGDGINLIVEATGGATAAAEGRQGSTLWPGVLTTFSLAFIAYAVARFLSVGAPQLRDAMFSPVSQDAQRLTAVRAFAHVQRLSIGYHQTKRTSSHRPHSSSKITTLYIKKH